MREILSQNMMQQIPNADVVITNPTHYAIALEYKIDSMQAPMVTAKGLDTVAQRIKQLAFENDVPVIENRPLARALHAEVELGDVIPERYYEAVVTVFKEIYRMNKKKEAV
jgi:flagellar biosynthetic protein FlhB